LQVVLLLIAAVVLWGCDRTKAPPVPPPVTCVVTHNGIVQWIQNPSVPSEPAGTAKACFYQLAWQDLFAVTQLVGNVPKFATWPNDQELFPAHGDPPPWRTGARPMRVRLLRKGLGLPGAGGVTADTVTEAAALVPLVDQNKRLVYFSIVVDQPEYDYIRSHELYRGNCFNALGGAASNPPKSHINRPIGSLELKLAWRVLETCDLPDSKHPCTKEDPSRYLTVEGEIQSYSSHLPNKPVKALLGLVGMHIVQKTKNYQSNLWMTFEHVDNAPDCGQTPMPPPGFSGWAFHDAKCNDREGSGRCQDNWYCLPCPRKVQGNVLQAFNNNSQNSWKIPLDLKSTDGSGLITCTQAPNEFNQPVSVDGKNVWIYLFDPEVCKAPPIPTQVCRSIPIGSDVKALNDQVREVLRQLGGSTAVLANYELVGVQYLDDKDNKLPHGQRQLANTTMETYLQNLLTGCVTCHSDVGMYGSVGPVPYKPPMQFNSGLADRSYVFQQIRQFDARCGTDQEAK
ncbi:MAG TPA: hypothetical protein VLX28_26550, partial [Thermoanaerobaculia bacterium]|nr:hypothetical protein [Thermoanaerobaculia bacterium]